MTDQVPTKPLSTKRPQQTEQAEQEIVEEANTQQIREDKQQEESTRPRQTPLHILEEVVGVD